MSILTPEDEKYLKRHFPRLWKILNGSNESGLLIKNYPLPEGYDCDKSDLMLLIPPAYPTAGLDMFYFDPPIQYQNSTKPDAVSTETHFERSWQRWSRHYQWEPGNHGMATHIQRTKNTLKTEAQKQRQAE